MILIHDIKSRTYRMRYNGAWSVYLSKTFEHYFKLGYYIKVKCFYDDGDYDLKDLEIGWGVRPIRDITRA